jgi:hypothetical protein
MGFFILYMFTDYVQFMLLQLILVGETLPETGGVY